MFGKALDVIENITTRARYLNTIDRPVIKHNKNLGQFQCLKFDDQLKSIDLKESINEKPNKTPFKPFEQVHIDDKELKTDAYKSNPKQQKVMESKLGELLEQGIIEESCNPWSASCLLVSKNNGTDHSQVTYFRGLNSKTVLTANSLSTTQESLENIGMTRLKWFTILDLQSGFFQAELDPSSKRYTAFIKHMGLF